MMQGWYSVLFLWRFIYLFTKKYKIMGVFIHYLHFIIYYLILVVIYILGLYTMIYIKYNIYLIERRIQCSSLYLFIYKGIPYLYIMSGLKN